MNETAVRLATRGVRVLHVQVNASGRHVYLLHSTTDGWDAAMFLSDADDLMNERATLDQIIQRNKGEDLADPWPAPSDLLAEMAVA